ncbi:Helix-turn-helix protein [Mycobacteroides abscessus]|uniref:Transcriptional regulator n=1 Tax=Mycolicibacterium conceptionense TaxID=451644 RepID=A0A1A1VIH5_9MYCO|nr:MULTISPECIES: helix-turn-helix domain-containing protein [Mycobacteriaceae]MCF6391176.1 helix-turn-helix domain-containing protein [Mycobacterium sp. MBM]MCW1825191.1 helix-turn-helix domain-containing protein [Mycolicibacterium senegalense]OBB14607.1 transcriptional regulator [Mycolicibacterium conceptionense]OBE94513.1 transcriptional regulator [Mycolicibacterium conceptionense]OBF24923.1 transcriptional regulator [Mycolicibacterium conceptionense]
MATSRLGALIDRYRAAHGASESELARRIGVTRENLRKWRTHGTRRLPDHANLVATARVIGRPYREVLSAALFDTGYLDGSADAPRPYNEVLADAIAVLTEATRLTNQLSRRNDTGQWETDPDPSASVPIDWAEFVTLAVAGAAANVGSAEEALAGRPGSWEADRVRQMLQATAFDDKDLLRHRTEPVAIDLWVESILIYLNDSSDDDYSDAITEVDSRTNQVPLPTDLPPGPFSPDDPRIASVKWINVDDNGYLAIDYRGWTGDPTDEALLTELAAEANRRDLTSGEIAYEQAMQDISAMIDALEEQQRREYAEYAGRLTEAIEVQLAALELAVPVKITINRAPREAVSGDLDKHAPPQDPRTPIEGAIEKALTTTPTPASLPGTPLDRLTWAQHQGKLGS